MENRAGQQWHTSESWSSTQRFCATRGRRCGRYVSRSSGALAASQCSADAAMSSRATSGSSSAVDSDGRAPCLTSSSKGCSIIMTHSSLMAPSSPSPCSKGPACTAATGPASPSDARRCAAFLAMSSSRFFDSRMVIVSLPFPSTMFGLAPAYNSALSASGSGAVTEAAVWMGVRPSDVRRTLAFAPRPLCTPMRCGYPARAQRCKPVSPAVSTSFTSAPWSLSRDKMRSAAFEASAERMDTKSGERSSMFLSCTSAPASSSASMAFTWLHMAA
mmetsp:Transcript_27649/g.87654  ORF Transcript_27649/g.87654 Transcript_27649/m.87654 type:complete len:274 (+) Transcript_27649:558-1379(+)